MSSVFAYLLLFLPLIASVFCFLVNFRKSDFLIFISAAFILLALAIKLGFNFYASGEIKTDSELGVFSVLTEYRLDFLALFFLLAILLSQIFIAFLYRLDLLRALNKGNRQLFYSVWLLNIFGAIGILTTNNIFNLFVFIEIYCLTLCAIITISGDLALSKLALQYFCNSVLGAILMLPALIVMYVFGEFSQINMIDSSLFLKSSGLISWLVVAAIILKFFPINLYFYILKSRDQLANILLNFTFVINGIVGFYLLFRVLLLLFDDNEIFFQVAIAVGFSLVFYSNYKIFRTKNIKVFAPNLLLANLGFVLITFLVDRSISASLTYVANYILSGLVLFFIAKYLTNHQRDSSWKNKMVIVVISVVISNLPLTLIFWANWHLALLSFNSNIYDLVIILPILSTSLALANFQLSCLRRI